ncbi:hypothetical protein PILCRDRAFT_10889 [Piloderma croceum F 1598]|uniref:Uncharacterized protein n=1 Tax=Piloderma croceum (strain F 1598) TaxID=765440 RepID=A0A0C3F2D5_PILCF|nr:hypothetical protein PILCRDRAFT_10889 [Piloderma croceum F 1598]
MPPKKNPTAASKASTATPRPRGRPPKRVVKSSEFIDDKAEEVTSFSDDDDVRSIKSTARTNECPRPRPHTASRAKSVSDDDDAMSVKSVASTNNRSRSRPAAKAKSVRPVRDDDDTIDISSGDDVMSVMSTDNRSQSHPAAKAKSVKLVTGDDIGDDTMSVKSAKNRAQSRPAAKAKSVKPVIGDDTVDISSGDDAMSVKSANNRSRSRPAAKAKSVKPATDDDTIDFSSDDDAMSVKSVKSAKSAMSIDDEEWPATPPSRRSRSIVPKTPVSSRTSSVMMPSPTKSVWFEKDVLPSIPLKGVLKKPEVVIPVKSTYESWDVESPSAGNPTPSPWSSSKASVSNAKHDVKEANLLSPFEEDTGADVDTPKKRSTKGKAASRDALGDKYDVFLEDFNTSAPPPKVDETDIGNRDPALKNTYKGLPKLRAACVILWSRKPALLPTYSGTLEDIPRINKKLFFEAVTFSGVGGVQNLSRSDPTKLSTGFGSQTYFHAAGGSGPLTFVSAVRVGECHLIDPKSNANGKIQRLIEGAVIEGEWERLVGIIGHVIDKVEYKAQIQAGYVSFATALVSPDSATSSASNARNIRRASGPNPFTRGPSSGSSTLTAHDVGFYDLVLEIDQLPWIKRELPVDSCAVVAYTVNTWGTPINVSFNVKWVMLLGVPGG